MIEDRKSRESRRGATETYKLHNLLDDDVNNDPIILETTLEEMQQIEYVNSMSRKKKIMSLLQ